MQSTLSIKQIANHILASRRISRMDQEMFMSALFMKDNLSPEEKMLVNSVFDALKQGSLRVA